MSNYQTKDSSCPIVKELSEYKREEIIATISCHLCFEMSAVLMLDDTVVP